MGGVGWGGSEEDGDEVSFRSVNAASVYPSHSEAFPFKYLHFKIPDFTTKLDDGRAAINQSGLLVRGGKNPSQLHCEEYRNIPVMTRTLRSTLDSCNFQRSCL